ncbi:hypothetical protein [Helicobacter cetorum]|nr:hypothetical protein [Helicobacter cetorum]
MKNNLSASEYGNIAYQMCNNGRYEKAFQYYSKVASLGDIDS